MANGPTFYDSYKYLSSQDVLIPPTFEPIAFILLGSDYKIKLNKLIDIAPNDLSKDKEWWRNIQIVTKATNEEIKTVKDRYEKMLEIKHEQLGKTFDQLQTVPAVQSDQELSTLIKSLAEKLKQDEKRTEELVKLQKMVQKRLETIDEIIRNREKSKPIKESKDENLITEGLFSKTVTKLRQLLASPKFKNIIGDYADGSKIAENHAKIVVRDVLQAIEKRCYTALEENGIKKRVLINAFRKRKEPNQLELLKKAAEILKNKKKIDNKRWTVPPNMAETQEFQQPQETQNEPQGKNEIQQMISAMVKAGKDAESTGKNKIQAAENVLIEYEKQGISDAPVVRRSWELYKNKINK